jgi:hypothetical protein
MLTNIRQITVNEYDQMAEMGRNMIGK